MPDQRPNVLWLMTDEQRCDSLGCYGSSWAHSPIIDTLAAEGALFETAITPAPVCLPARTSLLSGRYPGETGVWHNRPDPQYAVPSLTDRFRQAGYQTITFGKQHYAGAGSAFALETGPCLSEHVDYFRYAERYDETLYDVVKYPGDIYNWIFGGRFPASADETAESKVVRQSMAWLDANQPAKPFLLRLSFNGPHTPVCPPEPFDKIIDADAVAIPADTIGLPAGSPRWLAGELLKCADASFLSPEQIRKMRQYYFGEVSFLDHLIGKLLDWMRERNLLDNTIIVYLSDHGTHLGDFGLVQKQTFFDPVVNVPFILWYPSKIAAGIRFRTPVETRSLLPTLMELTGLDSPGVDYAPSLSGSLISGREPERRPVFSEFSLESFAPHIEHNGRLLMVRNGDWKLSVCIDPVIHDISLYDLKRDPYERNNRAGDPDCAGVRAELLELIEVHVAGMDQSHRSNP